MNQAIAPGQLWRNRRNARVAQVTFSQSETVQYRYTDDLAIRRSPLSTVSRRKLLAAFKLEREAGD